MSDYLQVYYPRFTRHYACQASTGEYGLEIQLWDSRSYCQYLSADKYKMSEEFTPLYLDEKTLNDSVEEFLQENSRQSKNYWVFEDNNLRYVYNSGVRKEHILLPRESLLSSGSGSGMNISDGTDSPKSSNGGEETDVGATIGGASLVILALMAIVGFIVEANKHCVLRGCQWVWGKLSDISFR